MSKQLYYPFHHFVLDICVFVTCVLSPIVFLIHIMSPFYFIFVFVFIPVLLIIAFIIYDFDKFAKNDDKQRKLYNQQVNPGGVLPVLVKQKQI